MAVDLKLLSRCAAVALLCSAGAAHALGPAAPFTPPRAAAAPPAGAIAAAPQTSALAGVRLGTPAQALIDGQWLRSGATVRGAVLVAITRHGVTLRHPDGRAEQLWLLPRPATAEHPHGRITPAGERAEP
jgi:hypothetical protein